MDIRNFITFNAIVQYGSFTKASQILNYAQSTITLHIQELEKHYETPLFNRIGKKITLTSFGKDLYQKTESLEHNYNEVLTLHKINKSQKTIRIGGFESILKYRLYDVIKTFSKLYPDVNLIFHFDVCVNLRQLVEEDELDVAFQLESKTSFPKLKNHLLAEEKLCFILPKTYTLADAFTQNLPIILTENFCSYRTLFEAYLNANHFKPKNITETSSVDLIKQYVAYGIGFSLLPEITLQDKQDKERYQIETFTSEKPVYSQIIYHKDKVLSPELKSFIDLVCNMSTLWR